MNIMNQKYALITGDTSGIGLELARLFARDKYNLVIVARSQAELDSAASELKQQFGIDVVTLQKDLFQKDAAFEVYNEVKAQGLQIDVLINDAGQGQFGEFTDTDLDRELDIIQLNICAPVILTKHFLKDIVQRGDGKILSLSCISSKMPRP